MHATQDPPWYQERAAFTINGAISYSSICKSKLYAFMRDGGLPFKQLGKRRLILKADLDRLIGLTP